VAIDKQVELRKFDKQVELRKFNKQVELRKFDKQVELRKFDKQAELRKFDKQVELRKKLKCAQLSNQNAACFTDDEMCPLTSFTAPRMSIRAGRFGCTRGSLLMFRCHHVAGQ
jgi:hypothetical protein